MAKIIKEKTKKIKSRKDTDIILSNRLWIPTQFVTSKMMKAFTYNLDNLEGNTSADFEEIEEFEQKIR